VGFHLHEVLSLWKPPWQKKNPRERSHDCAELFAIKTGMKSPSPETVEDTHDLQVTDKVGTHD
jgi:hypothetical protein